MMNRKYTTEDFNYTLPEALIAQAPLSRRPASRMMQVDRATGVRHHAYFNELVGSINGNDLLVFNDTRVFPARLLGQKETGGQCECLIERILSDCDVLAHVKASKSPKVGMDLLFADSVKATVLARQDDLFSLRFHVKGTLLKYLESYGQLPLPPYITRPPDSSDYERYQTVFAEKTGAVAAPTAGLHFDQAMLDQLDEQGIRTIKITLHVGAGTFQPMRVNDLSQHTMHAEWIQVTEAVRDAVEATRQRGGRVIAVGTTVLRALESAARSGVLAPYEGDTRLFITPGFSFHAVDGLLTNFHLPKSTLLMLVSAFAGYDVMRDAYRSAIDAEYRFFSYGDCMLIL